MSAEFGSPPWLFGLHSYEVIAGGAAILAVFSDPAAPGSQLGVIDIKSKSLTRLETGYTSFGRLAVVGEGVHDADRDLTIVTIAGSASKASVVVQLQVRLLGVMGPGYSIACSPA